LLTAALAWQVAQRSGDHLQDDEEIVVEKEDALVTRSTDLGSDDSDFMPDTDFKRRKTVQVVAAKKDAKPRRVPRIYFGTRTHKQIEQIVRELKKTPYKPRMAILGSRNQYCVNNRVSKSLNKNEEC
jgi:hypothetical protein